MGPRRTNATMVSSCQRSHYGVSAGSAVTFDARTFFRSGRPVLYGLYLFEEFYQRPAWNGLTRLADMIAAGTLHPHISREAPWGGDSVCWLRRCSTAK
jgi:hypothetical protein